jgi:DNA modification methylase
MDFFDHKDSKNKALLDKVKEEDRLGMHSFHRYYGKLIPAIPRAFIREFTSEGDLIFDPFSGSGTTALEAKYANRNFAGIEINPLSILIDEIKLADYDIDTLKKVFEKIVALFEIDDCPVAEEDIPFCVNRDHWFKDFVQKDLIKIRRNIPLAVKDFCNKSESEKYEKFYLGVLSAIVKQVSNADTLHVFPGISKRMRRLEAEGQIHINVIDTFKRASKKRIAYVEEIGDHNVETRFILGDSSNIDLSEYANKVDLVVTNPPYISSVRYAETLKLELYWMGICKSAKEYMDLSNSMIGNDHISTKLCTEKHHTNYDFVNELIDTMFEIDKKQARVIYDFFTLMERVIKNMSLILKKGKKLVMKISDSKIRKIKVPTGKFLTYIAERNGFVLYDVFNDKINENSRSLLTARNTYSDIILEDNIIIWEKK